MNRRLLWEFSVTVASEAEEAVAELFGRVFRRAPTVCTDLKTRTSTVSVYLRNRRLFTKHLEDKIKAGLDKIAQCELDVGAARVRLRRLRQRNWAEAWKKQFKPIRFEPVLLIKPSWSKVKPRKGELAVVLDPGLAFGTGHHPTTAFCLKQIVRFRMPDTPQPMLDIGTGSGILAIAAARLGYEPVVALDSDPRAVQVAKQNVKRNRLESKVQVLRRDVARCPPTNRRQFGLVCANLNAELLVSCCQQITKLVAPTGALVLAGVLESEFNQVRRAYQKAGFTLAQTETENGWRSGVFVHKTFKRTQSQ